MTMFVSNTVCQKSTETTGVQILKFSTLTLSRYRFGVTKWLPDELWTGKIAFSLLGNPLSWCVRRYAVELNEGYLLIAVGASSGD